MYLSRVEIDRDDRRKMKDLSHVGAVHGWVESSFPEEFAKEAEKTRKLWRIDSLNGKSYLLIVSPAPPSVKVLEKYGVKGTAQIKDYSRYLDSLAENEKYRFKVTLNPVVSVMDEPGQKRGRLKPHITVDQQMQFLYDRSEKNGFLLEKDSCTITERGFVPFRKSGHKTPMLSRVTYEGVLQIIDKQLFIKTLTQGFGKKKAYGFGMMTVIPEA